MPSALTVTVPCVGLLALVKVSASPSTSVATMRPLSGVSSGVVRLWLGATGASLAPSTVSDSVVVAVAPEGSLTV